MCAGMDELLEIAMERHPHRVTLLLFPALGQFNPFAFQILFRRNWCFGSSPRAWGRLLLRLITPILSVRFIPTCLGRLLIFPRVLTIHTSTQKQRYRLANRIYKCMISLCSTPTTYTSPPSRHSQTVVKKKSTITTSLKKSKQKTARNLGFQPFFDGASIHNGFAEKPVEHTDFHNILFFKGEMRYETDLPGDAPCAQVEPCCSICLRSSSAT